MFNLSIKKWTLSELNKDRASAIAEKWNIPFFLAVILDIRNITEKNDIDFFLSDKNTISEPDNFIDIDVAVKRIKKAIENFEKICVFGDYDADGVTATSLLYSYLESNNTNVIFYIPQRDSEGYGLSNSAIDKLKDQDISLIITVDNGISAIDEVEYAKNSGIDIIITDHHRIKDKIPNALAVIDPYRPEYNLEFRDFAGVGVAFKLIMALEGEDKNMEELFREYADLVTLGTIADSVFLENENRTIVKLGLKHMATTERLGLKVMLNNAGLYGKNLHSENMSYLIIPKINASGRLGSAEKVVKLLTSKDIDEAEEIANQIHEENQFRKQIELNIISQVEKLFEEEPSRRYDRVLVIEGENWHTGVIGIIASKICEKYGKPCIIISIDGDIAKGSGRSIEGFSLCDAIFACCEHLIRFGGHPMAAGLNIKTEKIKDFKKAIDNYAKNLDKMPFPVLKLDCKLNPSALSVNLIDQMSALEPFGCANPSPIFGLFEMKLENIKPVGGGKHLRLSFSRNNNIVTAMLFYVCPDDFPYKVGDTLDLAVTLSKSEYLGSADLSIFIKGIKLTHINIDKIIKQKYVYESIKRGDSVDSDIIESIIPNRDEFACVYRFLRNHSGWDFGLDVLCYRLRNKIKYSKLAIILDIMAELKLVNMNADGDIYHIRLREAKTKTDLNTSKILKHLLSLQRGEKVHAI